MPRLSLQLMATSANDSASQDQLTADVQPEAEALAAGLAAAGHLVEAVEDVPDGLGRDALAGIGHRDGHGPLPRQVPGRDRDGAAGLGELERVAEQVAEDLVDPATVGHDLG